MIKNKKGAEIAIGTLVIIIIAVVVLVVLIIGFTTGWDNLWNRISGYSGGGNSNIDDLVNICNTACTSQQKYNFCEQKQKIEDTGTYIVSGSRDEYTYAGPTEGYTCKELADMSADATKNINFKKKGATTPTLLSVKNVLKWRFKECPGITCPGP